MARKGGALKHLLFGAHPLTSELQQTWNQGLANHRGVDHVPAESETVDDVPGVDGSRRPERAVHQCVVSSHTHPRRWKWPEGSSEWP